MREIPSRRLSALGTEWGSGLEDILDEILEANTGRLDLDSQSMQDRIDSVNDKIDDENDRLDRYEERLVAKYARLETTLTLLQQQLAYFSAS